MQTVSARSQESLTQIITVLLFSCLFCFKVFLTDFIRWWQTEAEFVRSFKMSFWIKVLLLLHRGIYGWAGLGARRGPFQVSLPFLAESLLHTTSLQVSYHQQLKFIGRSCYGQVYACFCLFTNKPGRSFHYRLICWWLTNWSAVSQHPRWLPQFSTTQTEAFWESEIQNLYIFFS